MSTIGIFWGSLTGNTSEAASLIGEALGVGPGHIMDISTATAGDMAPYELLIFGTSTWGRGELQEDWAEFLPKLDSIDFHGKRVALFGLGDQASFPGYYVDAMGILYEKLQGCGAKFVGAWPADGYGHISSRAVKGGVFVGLALDADNEAHLTRDRVLTWVSGLPGGE